MSTEAESKKRPRGRPRSSTCHRAILAATSELLESRRYADVTMEGIAQRAGVAKQTLYKWWPSKAKLAMEAYSARTRRTIRLPDTGSFDEDLRTWLSRICRFLSRSNTGVTLAGLIAESQSDPELAEELRRTFVASRSALTAVLIERGIERGEVRADIDIPTTIDLLHGPMWYRLLLRHAPLDEAFACEIAARLLPGLAPPPSARIGLRAVRPARRRA